MRRTNLLAPGILYIMYEERLSESPFIQFLWRAAPSTDGVYPHMATEYWSFFFSSSDGKSSVYLSGPASVPRSLAYTAGGEYWGIVLKAHVFMPSLAKKDILNLNLALPMKDLRSFMFDHELLDVPTYETAEDFIAQLAEGRHIVANHVVAKALNGASWMAPRTAQRHVADTTGLTRKRMASIRRAQEAFSLLQKGKTIPEVIVAVGYVDQSHLTKSLKLLAGQTPAQILAMHADQ